MYWYFYFNKLCCSTPYIFDFYELSAMSILDRLGIRLIFLSAQCLGDPLSLSLPSTRYIYNIE